MRACLSCIIFRGLTGQCFLLLCLGPQGAVSPHASSSNSSKEPALQRGFLSPLFGGLTELLCTATAGQWHAMEDSSAQPWYLPVDRAGDETWGTWVQSPWGAVPGHAPGAKAALISALQPVVPESGSRLLSRALEAHLQMECFSFMKKTEIAKPSFVWEHFSVSACFLAFSWVYT